MTAEEECCSSSLVSSHGQEELLPCSYSCNKLALWLLQRVISEEEKVTLFSSSYILCFCRAEAKRDGEAQGTGGRELEKECGGGGGRRLQESSQSCIRNLRVGKKVSEHNFF